MIQAIATPGAATAAPPESTPAGQKTLCHTPFGDVMVDELAVPNLAGLFAPKSPDPGSAPPAAQAPAAQTPGAQPPASSAAPTTESLFGSQPWVDSPGGTGPEDTSWNFNPIYFATRQTADTVAKMVGGTVVEKNAILSAPGSPFHQNQPNEMIQLPNGREIYAGFIADFFNHGYPQSYIDRLIKSEVEGVSA